MGRYLTKHFFSALFNFFILMVFTFILLRLLPGSPFDSESQLSPEVINRLNAEWGINTNLFQQVALWMNNFLNGNWGSSSLYPSQTVLNLIMSSFKETAYLGFCALVLVFTIGTFMGVLTIFFKIEWLQLILLSSSVLFVGPLFIYLFSFRWSLFPTVVGEEMISWILPLAVLSLRPITVWSRILASEVQMTLHQPWVTVAHAMGLSKFKILFPYAFRLAAHPLIVYLGPLITGLLSGSVLVEMLFNIHGLGSLFLVALLNRDPFLVVGCILFCGAILIFIHWLQEILLYWLDPRLEKPI